MKSWYSSKVVWFNVLSGIAFLLALPTAIQLIPVSATPYLGVLTSLVNWVLRTYFTSTTIGSTSTPIVQ